MLAAVTSSIIGPTRCSTCRTWLEASREGDETASPFAFEALRSYVPRENVIQAVVMRLRLDALEKRT